MNIDMGGCGLHHSLTPVFVLDEMEQFDDDKNDDQTAPNTAQNFRYFHTTCDTANTKRTRTCIHTQTTWRHACTHTHTHKHAGSRTISFLL